jgi:hypothetical protein
MSQASRHTVQSRRLLAFYAFLAVLVTLASIAAPARAQSVVLTESGITRNVSFHTDPTARLWISRSDCIADDVFYFPVTLTSYAGSGLEVWAGESGDCSDVTQRSSSASTCWRVYTGVPTSYVSNVPIRVQDIISQRTPSLDALAGTAADCDAAASSATSSVQVTLYFMLIQGTAMQGTGATWSTKFDLVGPAAPTGVGVGVGGTMLKVMWNSNADTDVAGYTFFCDPPPGVVPSNVTYFEAGNQASSGGAGGAGGTAAADANASDAGGAVDTADASSATTVDGQTNLGTSCNMSVHLVADQMPKSDIITIYQCGSAGKNDTSLIIKGLFDYQTYAVAIASTDAVGNVGRLSTIECGTPQPIVGFYEAYRAAGGTAGGDSCAMAPARPIGGSTPGWLIPLAGVELLSLVRRGRRRGFRTIRAGNA